MKAAPCFSFAVTVGDFAQERAQALGIGIDEVEDLIELVNTDGNARLVPFSIRNLKEEIDN